MSKQKKEATGVCPAPKSEFTKNHVMDRVAGMARNRGDRFAIEDLLWCIRTWPNKQTYKAEAEALTDWLIAHGLRSPNFTTIEAMRCVEQLADAGYFARKEVA